jgi:RNA polymerase sigma-70 factor (ECF subfamily)
MASATADFERIYRRHARDVYRFALSVVRNPLEAEDVTQTTFMNAYRALVRGDRPDRPRSWLFAIAHNAIRSRDRWRLRRPPEVSLEVAEYRLAQSPDESPAVDDLLRALGDLPDSQREALALRELQGQTYPEIAEVLGVSVSAVESLIARARRALRAQRERLAGIAVLRRLCEQGNGDVSALAAKVSVVAAAAAAVAGGMAVETHVAGPAPAPVAIARPAPAAPSRTTDTTVRPTPTALPPAAAAPVTTATAVPPWPATATPTTEAAPAAASTTDPAQATSTSVGTAAATTSSAVTQAVTSSAAATVTTVAAVVPTTPTVTAPPVSTPTVSLPVVSVPTVTVPPPPPPPTVPLP